jgi:hypothetical protein
MAHVLGRDHSRLGKRWPIIHLRRFRCRRPRTNKVAKKAERILEVLGFEAACRGCEAVVTGEGRLDTSSLEGKLPVAVARRAHALGLPVIGHFGCKGEGWERAARLFDQVSFET